MMKKLFVTIMILGASMASIAQDATQKYSVVTNGFWDNWFVQAGFDWNSFYSDEETGLKLNKSPFKDFRSAPGFSVAVGKWFTPGIGLRTKFQGVWTRTVDSEVKNATKSWDINEQVLFNLSNLIAGYNPTRLISVGVFAGAGAGRVMSIDNYYMEFSGGVNGTVRINDQFNAFLEAGVLFQEHDADGSKRSHGKNLWNTHDRHYYLEAGLTYNIGKSTWEKTPDVDAINARNQAKVDSLNAIINQSRAENARLKKLADEKRPAPAPAKPAVQGIPTASVFYNINESEIADQKANVNLEAIAKYAKENNAKLVVTGYADSATGTAEFNQKLSEARANNVADKLVNYGVSRDDISVKYEGGVTTLTPDENNRRVTVTVEK